jgi:hypothetical protein
MLSNARFSMRLIRRTLLCVGVTAFGAAEWVFARPFIGAA